MQRGSLCQRTVADPMMPNGWSTGHTAHGKWSRSGRFERTANVANHVGGIGHITHDASAEVPSPPPPRAQEPAMFSAIAVQSHLCPGWHMYRSRTMTVRPCSLKAASNRWWGGGGAGPVGPGWSGNKLQLSTIRYNTVHTIRKLLFARTARKHKFDRGTRGRFLHTLSPKNSTAEPGAGSYA